MQKEGGNRRGGSEFASNPAIAENCDGYKQERKKLHRAKSAYVLSDIRVQIPCAFYAPNARGSGAKKRADVAILTEC